jgi:predicted amidohydrolase
MGMKVLVVSYPTAEGQVQDNVGGASEQIDRQLDREGADLVLLGEMFTCGYCARDLSPFAETPDGPSVSSFQALADRLDTIIGFGFAELGEGGRIFNSYALLEPGREPYIYRKAHLHISAPGRIENEPEYLAAGDRLGLVDTRLGRLGLMICYDGSIVEVPRCLAMMGAQAILWPARSGCTLGDRGVVPIRAIDNLAPVILAEGPQVGDFFPHGSHSLICDHTGAILGDLVGPGCLRADVDLNEAARLRAIGTGAAGVFQARRPELYRILNQSP